MSLVSKDGIRDRWRWATPQEPTDVRGHVAKLPHRLEYIEKFLTAARRERTNNQRDRWKYAFVHHLGQAWFLLTGFQPTHSGPFNDFVEEAWNSLSDNMPEIRWDWTVRLVLNINKGSWKSPDVILIPRQEKHDRELMKWVLDQHPRS